MYGVTARAVPALLAPTARAMSWLPFLAAAGFGLVIVAVPAAMTVVLSDEDLIRLLRLAGLCGAVGVAFLLDDPAARVIATVPTPRVVRHAVRAAVALVAAALWWVAVVAITVAGADKEVAAHLPVWDASLEAVAFASAALALAAARSRGSGAGAGVVAAPAVLVLALLLSRLPERLAMLVAPGDPRSDAAHDRWAALLALAIAGLLWAGHEPVSARRFRGQGFRTSRRADPR
ncbi:hypothetical protein [Phytohabitans aurantiacus]|jgi:hypothetical protein|uniref:ABC transporter n=1 Tax=Phytohabitans aurantiacus TaxID=3016789 RepID=A0ABQ5QWC2_9ACTN|nr:hypothetical protein [Phytohabitans aurantiacus]GLH98739.1 hypothetical protein Pa4123_40140 [Phytohabitans aurantiacus]